MTQQSLVYVVKALELPDHRIKVGVTTNLEKRLVSLQVGSPSRLEVVCTYPGVGRQYEKRIHKQFHEQRIFGEWFQLDDIGFATMIDLFQRRLKPYVPKSAPPANSVYGVCPNCSRAVTIRTPWYQGRHGKYFHKNCDDHLSMAVQKSRKTA